jgi:glycyl-tRNA synthetase (class II)
MCLISQATENSSNNASLNLYYIYNKTKSNESFLYLKRKRKQWWMKLLNKPELLDFNENDKTFHLKYSENNLENYNILQNNDDQVVTYLKKLSLNDQTVEVIHAHTQSEDLFLNIVQDSINKRKIDKNNYVFNLNLLIAPYKLCICVQESISGSDTILNDWKNMFLNENISVLTKLYKTEDELNSIVFKEIDEYGVPFSIIIDENSSKIGVCKIRNRDNTLMDNVLMKNLIKQFKSMLLFIE